MKISRLENMKGGWFIGDFSPTAFKTNSVEVSYKLHPKGEQWDIHYHRVVTEINLLVKGKMILQDIELNVGDIFVLEPYEITDPTFLEDTELVCVKIPGITNDKICLEKL